MLAASESSPIYQAMIAASPSRPNGFATGSDLLMDGGVIAAMRGGRLDNPV